MKTEILIIGTGTSGYTAAMKLKNAGKSVVIADRRSYGGTCAKRGCQAKKYLVTNTEIVHLANKLHGQGIAGTTTVNWKDLIRLKRDFTERISIKTEKSLTDAGITTLHGNAYFKGEKSVYVGKTLVEADKIILAAGSYPRKLNITGEEFSVDSEYFLDMDELPKRIIFIGGGYISFELAGVANSAGADVTILHRSEQVLKNFDPDLIEMLVEDMSADGVNILTNHPVEKITRKNKELTVTAAGIEFHADLVINVFVLAVKFGHKVSDLKKVLWAYPTHSSDIKYILH
jgi:glutathione reductase (NADPH)